MKGINLSGIGSLLGRHVEKIILGVVAIVALVLAWGGIDALRSKSVTTDHKPDAIATLARQAAERIETADAPPPERLPPLKPLGPLLDPWRPEQVKIEPSSVAAAPLARPLVLAARTKRETPSVFPLENLHTVAGIAVLESTDDPAAIGQGRMDAERGMFGLGSGSPGTGMLTQGTITPYVIVTGLIPAAKQEAEFVRCLGESDGMMAGGRDGGVDRNRPNWTGYRIERQERDPGKEFGDWKKLDPPPLVADLGGRGGESGGGRDLLPMDFRLQDQGRSGMAFEGPLPPRVVEDPPWGPEVVHPWFFSQIEQKRLASGPPTVVIDDLRKTPEEWMGQTVLLENVALEGIGDGQPDVQLFRYRLASDDPADEASEIGTTEKLIFVVSDTWGRSMLSQGARKGPDYSLVVRIDMVYDTPVARILEITKDDRTIRDPDPMSSGEGGGMALGYERRGMDEGMGPGRMGGDMTGVGEGAEFRSFRFLDQTVEPGKEYRYRVNISLNNPNEGLTPRELADPQTAKVSILTSDYSEPSDLALVPGDGFLVRSMSEQEFRLRRTLENKPLPPPKRGTVEVLVLAASEEAGNLALHKVEAKPGDEIQYAKPVGEDESPAGRGNAKKSKSSKPEMISTNAVLLDFRGEQLTANEDPDRMTTPPEPLEMLVLLPGDRFELISAIDSTSMIRTHEATLGEIPPDDPRGGRFDGGPAPRK